MYFHQLSAFFPTPRTHKYLANTGNLRYLEIKGNGENTSSFSKFEISKLRPKSSTLSHYRTEWFSTMFTPSIVNFFVFCFQTLFQFANVENADPKIDFLFSTSFFSFFFVDHEVPPMSFDFEVRHRKGETNSIFLWGANYHFDTAEFSS